jgi:Zn-dependent protease with chaperone function
MNRRHSSNGSSRRLLSVLLCALAVWLSAPSAQTKIKTDRNKYSIADDVKLGKEAAAQVSKELPLLNDQRTEDWVEEVGRVLVAAIPPEFAHKEFTYTFDMINQKEINAFALPGGPMFLNRGMIEAANTEGEVAGVMAHEISHVALRHGTAQATKGERFQLGALAGQVIGAVVGGTAGSVIAQGSQFGFGTYFLKFSRAYESQADLLGAQILARAGYDPKQMANMFRTIEKDGGGRQPEWMSSHPNPGNRYAAIEKEAAQLTIQGNASTGRFDQIRNRLAEMPPAPTAEEIARNKRAGRNTGSTGSSRTGRVEPPAATGRTYQPGSFLRITVPSNWQPFPARDGGVTYAPDGGFTEGGDGRTTFTHGLQIGVVQNASGNLQRDSEDLVNGFARSNPDLRRETAFQRDNVGGRTGLTIGLSNMSDVTGGRETVIVSTAQMRSGNVLFLIGVSPVDESPTYDGVFRRIRQSLQINDR